MITNILFNQFGGKISQEGTQDRHSSQNQNLIMCNHKIFEKGGKRKVRQSKILFESAGNGETIGFIGYSNNFIKSSSILMTTKLQKLERSRLPKETNRNESSKLPPFNQTIIINNPNININYLNEGRTNDPLSSRGLDNWNLNNNLKEFSETRQVGFFNKKRHNERTKSNSPYVIHKVRTQDIKYINKIYGAKPLKQTLSHFHKNQTLTHIAMDQVQPNPPSVLQKILLKQDKTITEKLYNHQKKNPKIELQKNFQTLPTTFLSNHHNPQTHPKTFRKNRFEVSGQNITSMTQRLPERDQESKMDTDPLQKRQQEEEQEVKLEPRNIGPRLIPLELRKRAFNRTIESINKNLLSQTESYLQKTFVSQVPQSQIEVFVNSLNQPEHGRSVRQRSTQRTFNDWMDYDFNFEEQKKKRPKTPKRKKAYENNQ